MLLYGRVIAVIIIIWAFIHTISYGRWTWKKKNKFGAVMLFILAVITLVLPVYAMFLREG